MEVNGPRYQGDNGSTRGGLPGSLPCIKYVALIYVALLVGLIGMTPGEGKYQRRGSTRQLGRWCFLSLNEMLSA